MEKYYVFICKEIGKTENQIKKLVRYQMLLKEIKKDIEKKGII